MIVSYTSEVAHGSTLIKTLIHWKLIPLTAVESDQVRFSLRYHLAYAKLNHIILLQSFFFNLFFIKEITL